MNRLPNGLRKSSGGYKHPLYARPAKRKVSVVPTLTPEEIAEKRAKSDAFIADFVERAGWNKPATPAQAKVADREARVAVEGDTDLNHDNVEAAE